MPKPMSKPEQPSSREQAVSQSSEPSPPPGPRRRRWLLAATATLAVLLAAIAVPVYLHRKRAVPRDAAHSDDGGNVRIPLKEVVRFKEKQWFVEELEASRDGDANAMLRLAKMYLHGQGCEKSLAMAQEWLRKARYLGVYCTLEELYAGEDWEAAKASAAAVARRALKQQEMLGQVPSSQAGYRIAPRQ